MRKVLCLGFMMCLCLALAGCSSSYSVYKESMFRGKKLLRDGDYPLAKREFIKASESNRDTTSLAFAATAAYKAQDVAEAARLIAEADKGLGNKNKGSSLRIEGYKALIFFSQGKNEAGFKSLGDYLELYETLYPMDTIKDVERMAKTRSVNIERLEALMDQQIITSENEMEKMRTNATGIYDRGGLGGH